MAVAAPALTLLLVLSGAADARQKPEPVSLCALVQWPDRFDGRVVVLHGSYRYGFEWQELFCNSCRGAGRIWLSLGDDASKDLARQLRRLPRGQGTINGTFTGIFRSEKGAYGDGGYKYQFDLRALSDVEIVSKSGAVPAALVPAERKRLRGCTAVYEPQSGNTVSRDQEAE